MILYPAIDLRRGRCVRLQQGDAAREVVFGDDPGEMARRWASEGAEWLHVVNLDGALGESADANLVALESILRSAQVSVQFGGGLRSVEDVDRLLRLGVSRTILGTAAVREPMVVQEAICRFGAERVAVGIDAREGRVAIHGWLDSSELDAVELAGQMRRRGVERIIYTDIARDGMLQGVNLEATVRMAHLSGLKVIASGGIASLKDLSALRRFEAEGIEGAIIGMALYRGTISFREALDLARGEHYAG